MENKLPNAILFDMDDIVLEYPAWAEEVWRTVCNAHAHALPGLEPEAMLGAIRDQREWYWSDPDRHRRGRLNLEVARREMVEGALRRLDVVAARMGEAYAVQRETAVKPFPGALDTLRRLSGSGVRLALVTNGNGEAQRRKVRKHGLAPLFDYILIEGDFGAGKPDERVYRHALDRLDAAPADSWMVGDNLEWEVEAPQRLGMTGIWLDSRGTGLPPSSPVRPDRVIRSLRELLV